MNWLNNQLWKNITKSGRTKKTFLTKKVFLLENSYVKLERKGTRVTNDELLMIA